MSDTPRTDAVYEASANDTDEPWVNSYEKLLAKAREIELELSAMQAQRDALQTQLNAWQESFGTTQLTHALAKMEAATKRADEAQRCLGEAMEVLLYGRMFGTEWQRWVKARDAK